MCHANAKQMQLFNTDAVIQHTHLTVLNNAHAYVGKGVADVARMTTGMSPPLKLLLLLQH
jgi:hypothetical protein